MVTPTNFEYMGRGLSYLLSNKISLVMITQKIVPVLKYDGNFCRKLAKIARFEVNLGYRGKFWTNRGFSK